MKTTPIRQCIVTRVRLPKSNLIRLVKSNGFIEVDIEQTKIGRGFYVQNDIQIIKKLLETNILSRATKFIPSRENYNYLIETLLKK